MPSADCYDEPSWGETLRGYTQTRSSLPWDPKVEGQPAKMVDTYSQHHPPARMFNPILMKFTDSSVEKLKTKQENAMNVHRLNVAKDKQLCYEQKFDIISHKSHLPVTEKSLAETLRDRPKPLDSRVTYNIVSHHQKAAHPELSIIPLDETPRQERPRVHPAITAMGGGEGLLPRSHATRPFDVISNRYLEDHDKKVGKDLSNLRKEAQVRYWQTHNYDPVVGRYYDGEKEGEYARQVKALEEVHGSCQQARLPPSIQYSEGQAYNIVTMTCKDQDKLSTAVDNANRAVASKKGALIEQGIRKRAEDAADLAAERRLERIARTGVQRAQMDGRHHGYDPITNEKHHGRGSKPLAPSRLRAPDPVWVKLHNETTLSASNSGGVGGGMGMGTSVKPLAKARDLTGAPAAPSSSSSADPAVTAAVTTSASARSAALHAPPAPAPAAAATAAASSRSTQSARLAATAAASTMKRDGGGGGGGGSGSGRLPVPPSARLSARSNNGGNNSIPSARQRTGGGRTNVGSSNGGGRTAPVVPALKMPANITALQNNSE